MLKVITGDGEGTPSVQHCISAGLSAQVARGEVRAVAVVVVDQHGGVGHMFYTSDQWASLLAGAQVLAHRLVVHGTGEPLEGEWDAESIPDGMEDPYANGGD